MQGCNCGSSISASAPRHTDNRGFPSSSRRTHAGGYYVQDQPTSIKEKSSSWGNIIPARLYRQGYSYPRRDSSQEVGPESYKIPVRSVKSVTTSWTRQKRITTMGDTETSSTRWEWRSAKWFILATVAIALFIGSFYHLTSIRKVFLFN